MTFEYLQRIIVDSQLEVEDIGQCCILGRTDMGEENYLMIRTELGWTEVIQCGPFIPHLGILPDYININYTRFEFNQNKIVKLIDKFLNDGRRGITQAEVVSVETIQTPVYSALEKIFPKSENIDEEC